MEKGIHKKTEISKFLIYLILAAEIVVFTLLQPRFLSVDNIFSMLRQVSMIGISAVGMTFILLTGGIDISIGPIVALTTVILALLSVNLGIPVPAAILVALLVCTFFGLINGFMVTRFNVPAMIATLGMMTTVKGIAYLLTGGIPIYNIPESLTMIGQGYLLGVVPIPVLIMFASFIFGYVMIEKTILGRYIVATGGSEEAARLSGIKVKKIKLIVYALSGFFSCIAGIIMCGRVNSGQPSVASGFEMDVIPAVVLGGVSLSGGEGSIINVFAGVLIMGVLQNGMSILGLGDYWQWVVKGIVLLLAVAYDNIIKGKAAGFAGKKRGKAND